ARPLDLEFVRRQAQMTILMSLVAIQQSARYPGALAHCGACATWSQVRHNSAGGKNKNRQPGRALRSEFAGPEEIYMRKYYGAAGAIHRISMDSTALRGNLLGDPSTRLVDVYVPAAPA